MTDQQHPLTPPFELMNQWYKKACKDPYNGGKFKDFASSASQWGWDQRGAATEAELQQRADQELEACCEWIRGWYGSGCGELINGLRAVRRPKPPSLKEQALKALREAETSDHLYVNGRSDIIRLALKQLND